MKEIEYFLDCSSPWTYLSFRGILELEKKKEFKIIWKPILVGGIFNSINPTEISTPNRSSGPKILAILKKSL